MSSCSPSKPGICRWAHESSTFQESPWAHPVSRQVLSLGFPGGFSALKELLWLCSQTNIWGFKGSRTMSPGHVLWRSRNWDYILCKKALWSAEALGLRERLSSTTPTYFLTCRGENSFLLIYSILLGFQVFFLAVSAYHKLGKWPREENTWSDSGSNGHGSGKAQTSGPEPGYVMETRAAVKQGKGSLTSLQSKLNKKGEANLLLGI